MNGEAIGSMQEPMETTAPHSPTEDVKSSNPASEADNINIVKNICNNSNDGENHLGSDDNKDDCENSETDESKYKTTNDNEEKQSVPTNETSNNIDSENHCSNSNDSYSDTLNSPKSGSNDSQKEIPDGMLNEQSQDSSQSKTNEQSEKPVSDNSDDEDDDEEESDDQDRDVVSINSDSENDQANSKSDIVLVEGDDSPNKQNGQSPKETSEVHEIGSDNDDCVVTGEKNESNVSNGQPELRRSARKRKRCLESIQNGNDESDVEVVDCEDPLNPDRRAAVKKTLKLTPVKKFKRGNNESSKHTVMLVDTNSILAGKDQVLQKPKSNSMNSISAQSLCQSIAARGTTVTPIGKTNSTPQLPQQQVKDRSATPPPILPSLTDDMFVVEAPSFIVPYVYEKPSLKPFREFVDTLGKELDEQKAKEEQIRLEKEKLAKEKKEKEKKERIDRGETVEDSDTEENKSQTSTEVTQKKEIKKQRRRPKNDDDDESWDGESTSSCDDDLPSDDDNGTQIIKEKDDSLDGIKEISTDLTLSKSSGASDSYFDCSLGKFFLDIGLNLVQEYVQNDLLKQQTRKLQREKKAGHSHSAAGTESSIVALTKNIELSKENNSPYQFKQSKCEFCSFKSESQIVILHHLETPHMKNNLYKCNFCDFEIRSPHEILFHMEAEHKIRGRLERAPSYHQCPNCPFEDNGKGKLARHQLSCAKKYKPEINSSPPVDWDPPAKIPKISKPRNNVMSGYQSAFNRAQMNTNAARATANMMNMFKNRIRPSFPATTVRPQIRSNLVMRPALPTVPSSLNINAVNNNAIKKTNHQPSISITPLARGQQAQSAMNQASQSSLQGGKGTFVICEICDGYIKDLEQLRNHMQWIHKVKIHPKMIYNRPPLNCQKCQFRFFTDQGLERHLLGSHGLVTSSMQEAANKGKDAGRCPVCGKVYQWKLLNHVARDHNLTLKPAHLSYKCTVCTATFGMYKQFESHVYSAHRVVAKRVMDKSKTPPAKASEAALKSVKINDEITIVPQPEKPSATASNAK